MCSFRLEIIDAIRKLMMTEFALYRLKLNINLTTF